MNLFNMNLQNHSNKNEMIFGILNCCRNGKRVLITPKDHEKFVFHIWFIVVLV